MRKRRKIHIHGDIVGGHFEGLSFSDIKDVRLGSACGNDRHFLQIVGLVRDSVDMDAFSRSGGFRRIQDISARVRTNGDYVLNLLKADMYGDIGIGHGKGPDGGVAVIVLPNNDDGCPARGGIGDYVHHVSNVRRGGDGNLGSGSGPNFCSGRGTGGRKSSRAALTIHDYGSAARLQRNLYTYGDVGLRHIKPAEVGNISWLASFGSAEYLCD